ncbi:MAG: ABC transporter ATP-binding protein [Lachnospiraceae bacterium]|nr:ABC transporter ATP-binding protein [Lachnospiraceae bacterium]
MIKMFRYLKKSAGYIVIIIALLFIQAYCDLALPSYTSKIVDTGIQQKGVEDAVPDQIRKDSMDALLLLMPQKEQTAVTDAYTLKTDMYQRNTLTKKEREKINQSMAKAMLMVTGMKEQGVDISTIPPEQIQQMLPQMEDKIDALSDSIVTQAAVAYVQAEYEAQGLNIDTIQTNYVLHSGLSMLGVAALAMLAAVLVTFLASRVAASLGRSLRNHVFEQVLSFSSHEMNQYSTASLITRSTNDIQQVQMFMTMLFRIVLYAPILGIGGIIRVLQTESSMTWILAIGVALILLVILVLMTVAMPKFKKLQSLIDRLNLVMREILTGLPVIRAFSTEKHEEERFEKANQDLTKTNLFVNRCMTFMMPIMMLIMNGLTVLIVFSGAHSIDAGSLQVGDMMAFIQYAMQIIMSFLMISMVSVMMPRASVSAKRINEVLDTKPQIHSPKQAKIPEKAKSGEITFEHVSFSYPGAEEEVLTDISFTARKGETVAFIGSTGSGKSTLINLIPRFYDVTAGRILIDGVDIRDMDLKDLRSRLGYVPQKGVLFSGDISSNLRFGKEDASQAELEKAAEVAQSLDFIEEKEEKFDSPIAQGGTNVSGGQKQRLSIARAIVKNPEIYIFDDSFSALDYKTDAALRKALKQYTRDATSLIVAQRISTILQADQILVLNDGVVAGSGTHKELMKTCEVYQQIAKSQLSEEELNV